MAKSIEKQGWTENFKEGAKNVLKGGVVILAGVLALPYAWEYATAGYSPEITEVASGIREDIFGISNGVFDA